MFGGVICYILGAGQMPRVPIREYAATRVEGEVRALVAKYKLDVQPSAAGETVAADTLDQLFAAEDELKQLGPLRSQLSATQAELAEAKPSMWHVKAATVTAAISAVAACLATGLTMCSTKVAGDQLDAKNRYEVQILVANKLTETASAPAGEVTNRLFDFNSAFVIANDLHEDGGFVKGWQEFIDRYCGPLKDKNFYKGDDDPLADTRSICQKNTQ
ncbi:hypothetical protein ACI2KT_07540 [Ensifer adhaerens]|jgi:hypothetical protein|uniref:hypothetical protein n=2 Tax=Sinorhizobium/Ensifer group TaxID=227292 RepID=UPI00384C1DDA